jgi:hypothetical protein
MRNAKMQEYTMQESKRWIGVTMRAFVWVARGWKGSSEFDDTLHPAVFHLLSSVGRPHTWTGRWVGDLAIGQPKVVRLTLRPALRISYDVWDVCCDIDFHWIGWLLFFAVLRSALLGRKLLIMLDSFDILGELMVHWSSYGLYWGTRNVVARCPTETHDMSLSPISRKVAEERCKLESGCSVAMHCFWLRTIASELRGLSTRYERPLPCWFFPTWAKIFIRFRRVIMKSHRLSLLWFALPSFSFINQPCKVEDVSDISLAQEMLPYWCIPADDQSWLQGYLSEDRWPEFEWRWL